MTSRDEKWPKLAPQMQQNDSINILKQAAENITVYSVVAKLQKKSLDKPEEIRAVLERYWGHRNFRPMQEEIIRSVLSGKDVLALMPTGGGKSVTFQVPALVSDGICLVVTPLIALMKDQVDQLLKMGIKAAALHLSLIHI